MKTGYGTLKMQLTEEENMNHNKEHKTIIRKMIDIGNRQRRT